MPAQTAPTIPAPIQCDNNVKVPFILVAILIIVVLAFGLVDSSKSKDDGVLGGGVTTLPILSHQDAENKINFSTSSDVDYKAASRSRGGIVLSLAKDSEHDDEEHINLTCDRSCLVANGMHGGGDFNVDLFAVHRELNYHAPVLELALVNLLDYNGVNWYAIALGDDGSVGYMRVKDSLDYNEDEFERLLGVNDIVALREVQIYGDFDEPDDDTLTVLAFDKEGNYYDLREAIVHER